MTTNKLAVYLHIPFCAKKCAYCDFTSYSAAEDQQARYVDDLLLEISLYADVLSTHEITTVYFGGGTPSALPLHLLERLFRGLPKAFFSAKEITFEMNPESVHPQKLSLLRSFGVNRISLGVQSLEDKTLKTLGRIHSADAAIEAVEMIRAEGFENLSIDLIYAIASEHPIGSSVREILRIRPEHISVYPLELYPHRPLANILQPASEELSLSEFSYLLKELTKAGYERYEVSNFSLPGFASRHNSAYWERQNYLGLGVSAHSLIGPKRFSNVLSLEEYHDRLTNGEKPIEEESVLSASEQAFETLMLGLRISEGVDLFAYKSMYGEFSPRQKKSLLRLQEQGLLHIRESRLLLTEKGMDLMNVVLVELMD